jgi:putative transposase
MPRKPRFYLSGVPAHVVQRGNSRQATFFSEPDYSVYLDWLYEGALAHGCAIHAYVLMTNHVHLLVSPQEPVSISRLIQFVGRRYVRYINRTYAKSGTLWEGRHKGCVISSESYLLSCMRYIELNPVRAGMVESPGEYCWSSHHANAVGRFDKLITPHPCYFALGATSLDRCEAYRALFNNALLPEEIHTVRATVQTGTPLGNERFKQQIEDALHRRVGHAARGRPPKKDTAMSKGY